MDEFSDSPPLASSPSKPSKTPSWIMLGFLLGVLFVWLLPRAREPVAAKGNEENPRLVTKIQALPRLLEIEAVFAEWGQNAVWENDLTEVALWNDEAKACTDFFEVLRTDGNNYFRSIPRLTRPLLKRGIPANSPLEFTEPESHRQEWLRQVDEENRHTFFGAVREKPVNPPAPSQPASPPRKIAPPPRSLPTGP